MGQDPGVDEKNHVDFMIDPVISGLRERDVYYLPDVDSIPDEAFIPLTHCLAWACAAGFGQHKDEALYQLCELGQKDLQIIQAEKPHYTILEVQAY
jgi:hypothetical protein